MSNNTDSNTGNQRTRLSPDDITERLQALPYWRFHNNMLERVHTSDTYVQALALLNKIGQYAESVDHHPDLYLRYKELTIGYWTHNASGVTALDFDSAHAVEKLIRQDLR